MVFGVPIGVLFSLEEVHLLCFVIKLPLIIVYIISEIEIRQALCTPNNQGNSN